MSITIRFIIDGVLRKWRAKSGGLLPWSVVAPPVDFDAFRKVEPVPSGNIKKGRVVFAFDWVMQGAGGMSDLVHFGEALKRECGYDVYYCVWSNQSRETVCSSLRFVEPNLEEHRILQQLDEPPEVLIAGVWTAAYRSLREPARVRIFFAQDYDALFHPAGLIRHYAQAACDLPLEILTLGPWLVDYIRQRHPDARLRSIPFPMTDSPDQSTGNNRPYIAFYLQPQKLHRGAPLLVEAARRLHPILVERYPGKEIVFFGSKDNSYAELDFPCRSLGVIPECEIRQLCRESAVGVSFSLTNISLLPFRFTAHGSRALELNLPHIHANVPPELRPLLEFYEPHPDSIVEAVLRAIEAPSFNDADWAATKSAYDRQSWTACARRLGEHLAASGVNVSN